MIWRSKCQRIDITLTCELLLTPVWPSQPLLRARIPAFRTFRLVMAVLHSNIRSSGGITRHALHEQQSYYSKRWATMYCTNKHVICMPVGTKSHSLHYRS